jgi:hypothetical protein
MSSWHSLINFLPLFSITFDCRLSQFSAAVAKSGTRLNSSPQLPPPELDSILRRNCHLRNSTRFFAATATSGTRLDSSLQLPTPELHCIQFLCSPAHILAGGGLEIQLTHSIVFVRFITPRHGPRGKHSPLYCWEGVFTAPLHSNWSNSIVVCIFVGAGICLLSSWLAPLISLFRLTGVMSQYNNWVNCVHYNDWGDFVAFY